MFEEEKVTAFQVLLLDWYDRNKRSFPWRYTYNPYYVLVSEMLLQQTNVEKVVDPYLQIIRQYSTVQSLAQAEYENLKGMINKIGLFYRVERLISISKHVVKEFNGHIPSDDMKLLEISGIGRYIAHAILCFGYNLPFALLDTNIIRICERVFDIKSNTARARDDKKMWEFVEYLLPDKDYVDFNYALLDFGALTCKNSNQDCSNCILTGICQNHL